MWFWHWCQQYFVTKKSCYTWFWSSWPNKCNGAIDDASGIICYSLQCQWHHITKHHVAPYLDNLDQKDVLVPFIMLSVSCDTNTVTNGVTWQKSHVVPHLDCLDLRNAGVPLLMSLVLCNTDVGVSGVTWPKKSCCTSFQMFCHGMQWHHWWHCQWCHMTKESCFTSFQLSWHQECNGDIDDAVTVTLNWCQLPVASHDKKVMLYLILIVLT